MKRIVVFLFILAVAAPAALAEDLPLGKKLIEYGWDVPFSDFVGENIGSMTQRPFDGLIFKLRGGVNVLTPEAWNEEQFAPDTQALEGIQWGAFTDNFVLMLAASDLDWFNDEHWAAIANNARLMSRVARAARCVGVCFDAEPYGTNPWDYQAAPHKAEKSFAEYEVKVRERGAQFIQAIQQEFPDPVVLTFFMFSYLERFCQPMSPEALDTALSDQHYGLYPAFINGMLDGAEGNTRFVDGNETAYYYTDKAPYFEKYNLIKQRGRHIVDPALWPKYDDHIEAGQALYIDQYYGLRTQKVLGSFLTDEERPKWFEHNVYYALYTTDRYVWCYSERMNWWKDEVPPGTEDAIRAARQKLVAGEPLGYDLTDIVQRGGQREQEEKAKEGK